MPDAARPLDTRWSVLQELRGPLAEETWAWFIERYRPYVRALLARHVRGEGRVEQVTDELWSYLFTSSVIENADRDRRFRTYLAGVVRHFALRWLREHSRGRSIEGVDVADGRGDPSADLEAAERRLWKGQVVQLALGRVADRQEQQARALRWFYGIPEGLEDVVPEPRPASWIAERLELQPNAVHQLLFRARNRLRSCIEDELRDSVADLEELQDEVRLVYEVIAAENPGLEG